MQRSLKESNMTLRIRGRLYALVALFGIGCATLAGTLIWLQGHHATQATFFTVVLILAIGSLAVWVTRGIALPLAELRTAMLDLAENRGMSGKLATSGGDEIGDMVSAIEVFRENAVKRAAHQASVDSSIAEFRDSIGNVLSVVAASVDRLETTAKALSDIGGHATGAAGDARRAPHHSAGSLVSGTEKIGGSVAEIGHQVGQANQVVSEANALAVRINSGVAALTEAAQKIDQVVDLIRATAEQTNSLVLNATIEAARAGEAGRGFAVVASEVQSLASQTARVTEEIGAQVTGIQTSTKDAVGAIGTIAATMDEINRVAAVIAATVDEQAAATRGIARDVGLVNGGMEAAAGNARSVTAVIAEASRSAKDVLGATERLAEAARRLQGTVDGFRIEAVA
jgi:methyl-accepting chemotaxis protein